VKYASNGQFTILSTTGNIVLPSDWGTPNVAGGGADYDIFCSYVDVPPVFAPVHIEPDGPPVNTWLSLSVDREWTISATTIGDDFESNFTISIRDASTLTVLDTSDVLMLVSKTA